MLPAFVKHRKNGDRFVPAAVLLFGADADGRRHVKGGLADVSHFGASPRNHARSGTT
jgi:hypothetical protein